MRERIRDYMTRQPWTVQIDDSLTLAREMMDLRGIHHLPVLDAGVIVGIVTKRDLDTAGGRRGTVVDLMRPARQVASDTRLSEVLEIMTREHCDAVVIGRGTQVEGIFTTMDALRVLAQLVHERAA